MQDIPSIEIPLWPYVFGGPQSSGKIKSIADDFIVEEHLPFQPEGVGEHAFLCIEKRGENTEYVARLLARFAGVRQRDVGYAGLKDRHAKTLQWFSVWLPGKDDPDWKQIETETISVLTAVRHSRKLKRGVLKANSFQLTIRNYQGDKDKLKEQIEQIKTLGFPNYFGPQRFGHHGQNINKAITIFQGLKVKREQRGIYFSAARSYLFNMILAERIALGTWNKAISGDCCIFNHSNSYFKLDKLDDSVLNRIERGEIHPAAVMAGKGELETSAEAFHIEQSILDESPVLIDGLIKNNLTSDRRALRVFATDLQWQFKQDAEIQLRFSLPAGSYATSLLRELLVTN